MLKMDPTGGRTFLRLTILVSVLTIGAPVIHGPAEFCEREKFEAKCASDEVILIQRATYGRMNKGRCVKTDYGSLGCQADVIRVMDSKCSGRQECSFPIVDLHSSRSCPGELLAYLEASWECIKVHQCGRNHCGPGRYIKVDSASGFLASSVTAQTSCGSSVCPWVLTPKPGQSYNLTLFNFHQPNPDTDQKYCHRYATIKDQKTLVSKDVTVCGKEDRFKTIHLVDSSQLEVRMFTGKDENKASPFLLRFEAVGCPDITPPEGAYVTHQTPNVLTVKCNFTQRAWHLTCSNNAWVGKVGSCGSKPGDAAQHGSDTGSDPATLETVLESAGSTPEGLLLVVGIGVTLGVILGFVMLAIAVVCMKRRQKQRQLYHRQSPLIVQRDGMEKGEHPSFQADSGSLSGKQLGEDPYFKTYQPRTGDPNVRRSHDSRSPSGTDAGSFPAPPPPPYYHSTVSDISTGRLKEHTYESPNFSAQAQRDSTVRRGSDVS